MKKFLLVIFASMMFMGCEPSSVGTTRNAQMRTMDTMNTAITIPTVSYFQERRTIAKWVQFWDKPSIPTYVYLVSFGKILGYYVADGKPSSTRSYLLPEERIGGSSNGGYYAESMPDLDGTYGDNNAGIRFFTAEGIPVEWAGDGCGYLYSAAPIKFGYEVPRLFMGEEKK